MVSSCRASVILPSWLLRDFFTFCIDAGTVFVLGRRKLQWTTHCSLYSPKSLKALDKCPFTRLFLSTLGGQKLTMSQSVKRRQSAGSLRGRCQSDPIGSVTDYKTLITVPIAHTTQCISRQSIDGRRPSIPHKHKGEEGEVGRHTVSADSASLPPSPPGSISA